MSKTWKFKHSWAGYKKLMKSDEVKSMLQSYGYKQKSNLGRGYIVEAEKGKTRWGVNIWASTKKAQQDNLKNNTMLKSLGGGKL